METTTTTRIKFYFCVAMIVSPVLYSALAAGGFSLKMVNPLTAVLDKAAEVSGGR